MTSEMPVRLRPAGQADLGFILHSWLRSYADSGWARCMGQSYWTDHHAVVENLVRDTPSSPVLVACWEEDPELIVGWLCGNSTTIHYVYTRHKFRHKGIAKHLLSTYLGRHDVIVTHRLSPLEHPLPSGWAYRPYLAIKRS